MKELLRLIASPVSLLQEFESGCNWAEEIRVCTSRIDSRRGTCPGWRALISSHAKVVVVTNSRMRDEHAFKELHRPALLRWIDEEGGRFRPNVYLFLNQGEVRALVGSARLAHADFTSSTNLMILWHGPRHHPFAAELLHFFEHCRGRAFLPGSGTEALNGEAEEGESNEADAVPFSDVVYESVAEPRVVLRGVTEVDRSSTSTTEEAAEHEVPRPFDPEELELTPADIAELLLGEGALKMDDAIRHAAARLREAKRVSFQRLKKASKLYVHLEKTIHRGVRQGDFDKPRRGMVRAIRPNAVDYSDELWERCVLASRTRESAHQDQAVRDAAEWAKAVLGLNFQRIYPTTRIHVALTNAIDRLVARKRLERSSGGYLRNLFSSADL